MTGSDGEQQKNKNKKDQREKGEMCFKCSSLKRKEKDTNKQRKEERKTNKKVRD